MKPVYSEIYRLRVVDRSTDFIRDMETQMTLRAMTKTCRNLTAACVMVSAILSCTAPARPGEGFINVEGGRVWYHRVGTGTATPLLILHGGPGSCSQYLKPLLALSADRPVIIYDQLGCGKSDRPTDTTLYTVDRFVRELQTVRDSLELREVHLYGHSWGAMLAEAYMGTRPTGVRSVIIASPVVTTAQWAQDADSLQRTLPDSTQQIIARHEANGTTSSPEYQAAMNQYYDLYVWRKPRAKLVQDSIDADFGKLVYEYMWGPSEFTATGTLKNFDARPWLATITQPTLFMVGEHDEAVPASVQRFSTLVKGARFAVIPGSAHVTHHDNLPAVLSTVRAFLHDVEAGPR